MGDNVPGKGLYQAVHTMAFFFSAPIMTSIIPGNKSVFLSSVSHSRELIKEGILGTLIYSEPLSKKKNKTNPEF